VVLFLLLLPGEGSQLAGGVGRPAAETSEEVVTGGAELLQARGAVGWPGVVEGEVLAVAACDGGAGGVEGVGVELGAVAFGGVSVLDVRNRSLPCRPRERAV
jgi:hypothetical protein